MMKNPMTDRTSHIDGLFVATVIVCIVWAVVVGLSVRRAQG